MDRRFITLSDAIKLLGLSRMTVNRFIYRGEIPAYKVGKRWLFDKEELIDWVKAHRIDSEKKSKPYPSRKRKRARATIQKKERR